MDRLRHASLFLLASFFLVACGSTLPTASRPAIKALGFPLTVTDDLGRRVTVAARPRRIASVTEGTDEILLDLVGRSRMVAVTKYAADPGESWVANKVGNLAELGSPLNVEQLLALRPDLIFVASYTDSGVVRQLMEGGVPVIELKDFNSEADIEQHIRLIGRAVGERARAQGMVASMRRTLAAVRAKVGSLPRVRLLYYTSTGYVFGKGSTPDELVHDAGGTNVADAAGIVQWKTVSLEQVAALKPDVLLTDASDRSFANSMLTNPALAAVPAVRAHRLLALPARDLTVVSQYFAQAVAAVAAALHPAAFGH